MLWDGDIMPEVLGLFKVDEDFKSSPKQAIPNGSCR